MSTKGTTSQTGVAIHAKFKGVVPVNQKGVWNATGIIFLVMESVPSAG